MKLSIEGNEVVLNETKLQTLLDAGYEIDDNEINSSSMLEQHDTAYFGLTKGQKNYYVIVNNYGESKISFSEGVLSSLYFSSDDISLKKVLK